MEHFLCNTLQQAFESAEQTFAGRRRDFDVVASTFQQLRTDEKEAMLRSFYESSNPTDTVAPGAALSYAFNSEDPGVRHRVWGSPLHSAQEFTGLAYCLGGRPCSPRRISSTARNSRLPERSKIGHELPGASRLNL
jgi:hypothetical protein